MEAVLALLAGEATADVAHRYAVDVALLHRWRRAFLDAGTAAVTNRPDDREGARRDRFLAAFAHEMRTPLAIAQGWLAVLADDLADDAVKHFDSAELTPPVVRTQEALARLTGRVVDVELLANAALGRLRLHHEDVLVDDVIAAVPHPVRVTGLGSGTPLRVDPGLFGIVLRDLWTAGLSVPEPRSLALDVRRFGPWLELSVVRDGDPVDPRVLQALFDPFDLNDDDTGVTIGLYLARALTVAHAGTLGIDQNDHGARIWVRVPDRFAA